MKTIFACLSLALGLFSATAHAQVSPQGDTAKQVSPQGDTAKQVAGDRVLARWAPDGLWYPAKVQLVDAQGSHVAYDDGDLAILKSTDVRNLDWRVGTPLECNWHNKGKYFPGKVAAMRGETIDFAYADGDAEKMTISRCRSR